MNAKNLNAYLIDPENKTVSIVTVEPDGDSHLDSMYKHIKCDLVDVVYVNRSNDVLFLDDEGRLKPNHYFFWRGYHSPLAGRALVLGTSDDGDTIEPRELTLESVKDHVQWLGFVPEMTV